MTCIKTGWTFMKSSCHSGYTFLANSAGWRVTGDVMPGESPDNSLCWVCVYLYDVVVKLLLTGKNLESKAAKMATGT